MKDVQATGEAFRPQKKKSTTSKHECLTFSIFGSVLTSWIRTRITNVDPDRTDQNQFEPGSTTLDDSQQYNAVSRRATTRPYCIVIAREEAFLLPESNTALQNQHILQI
jgi:hypothetical protein